MSRVLVLVGFALTLASLSTPASAQEKWGTIKGRIIWGTEKIPVREDLTPLIQKNPDKEFCLKDGKVFDERWVVNEKNKGIQWTFVWLSNGDPKLKKPIPIHPKLAKLDKDSVVIDQPICMYLPHAIGLRQGQTLIARNSAKVAHNVLIAGPGVAGNPLVQPGNEQKFPGLMADLRPTIVSLRHPSLDEGVCPRVRPSLLRHHGQGWQLRDQGCSGRQV